jgi:hypothetical protein
MQMVSFVFTNQYLTTNLIDKLVYVQIFCLVGKDVSTSPFFFRDTKVHVLRLEENSLEHFAMYSVVDN